MPEDKDRKYCQIFTFQDAQSKDNPDHEGRISEIDPEKLRSDLEENFNRVHGRIDHLKFELDNELSSIPMIHLYNQFLSNLLVELKLISKDELETRYKEFYRNNIDLYNPLIDVRKQATHNNEDQVIINEEEFLDKLLKSSKINEKKDPKSN